MENLFFFPLTLSAQPILPFFFSFPRPVSSPAISPRQPVPRRPVSPLPARSGPAPPPPSLSRCQEGPACRERLPPPSEPDSGSESDPIPRAPPPSPSWARTPRSVLRPYKRNPRPLETPNRSRSRRLRKNLARAAAIVEASRSFAAPPFRFVFSTTSLLRSSAVVRGTSPTFYLPPSRSVSAAVARRRFRSAMRRR